MMEMKNVPTALLIGGDHRMAHAAKEFRKAGYAVTLWGQDTANSPPAVSDAAAPAELVVLPIPVTRDGMHLNAPLSQSPIPLDEVVNALRPGQTVAGGTLPQWFADILRAKGCSIYDYQTDDGFVLPNALATAEGAIALAITESDALLAGSECAVLGFGRIGKQLCRLLSAMGGVVTVLARKAYDRTLAETLGYQAYPIDESDAVLPRSLLIFNTIPVRLLDFAEAKLPADGIIIDLAPIYEPSAHPKVIRGAALPAKYSPAFAGRLIARCVLAHLGEVETL